MLSQQNAAARVRVAVKTLDAIIAQAQEPTAALLTRLEAAARLRVAVRTLDALVADGKGPTPTRIGRRVLFAEPDLIEWLVEQRQPASGQRRAA